MNYIEIVTDVIQYIESNLHRKLCLEELASRYYISPMHFYRIFRAAKIWTASIPSCIESSLFLVLSV
ncbi:MAG: hypothetical protein ACYC0Q_16180 [Eubacteriales bacterium]